MKKLKLIAIVAVLVLFSCASKNKFRTNEDSFLTKQQVTNINSVTLEKVKKLITEFEKIANEIYAEKDSNFRLTSDTFENKNQVDSSSRSKAFSIELKQDMKYKNSIQQKLMYPAKEYTIQSSPDAANFVSSIKQFLVDALKQEETSKVRFVCEFKGYADKSSISNSVGKYNGEFGPINETRVLLNSKPDSISLSIQDSISNMDLAFLRAYGTYHYFLYLLKISNIGIGIPNFEKVYFAAYECQHHGSEYRFAEVSIKLSESSKMLHTEKN